MIGSLMGRGSQYTQLVKVLYCKLPTIGKELPTFPHRVRGLQGEQRSAHKNSKMQFLENNYAVWFHKSYQNEKRFLKL